MELRVHVRQGALTVTVLDAEARVAVLPSVALTWQALFPTPDRDALRVPARFERQPSASRRGWGGGCCRAATETEREQGLAEPALKQLRFTEDRLKPSFDLETVGGDTIIVKAAFQREDDDRRFLCCKGAGSKGGPAGTSIPRKESHARLIAAFLQQR